MKLKALNTISNGIKTYVKGDVFETDKDFTEALVESKSAEYLEPQDSKEVEIPEDLDALTVAELKEICKNADLEGYSNKNKAELIELIESSLDEE